MPNAADRLLEIARQLDELAGDETSPLITLSEELGEIASNWPTSLPPQKSDIPPFLREIQHVVEREMIRRSGGRRFERAMDGHSPLISYYDEINRMYPSPAMQERMLAAIQQPLDKSLFVKTTAKQIGDPSV